MRITAPVCALVAISGCGPQIPPEGDDADDDDADVDTSGDDMTDATMSGTGQASTASPSTSATTAADGGDTSPISGADGGESTDGGEPVECPGDLHEPNDTPATATPLDINPVKSTLCTGDVDEWWFELDGPSWIEPSIVAEPFGMGFRIAVLDPAGVTVLEAVLQNEIGDQQDIIGEAPTGGRHTVRIELFDAAAGPTDYRISVEHE